MRNKDQLILENIYSASVQNNPYGLVLEAGVDWDRFGDVKKSCYSAESVEKALNDELDRLSIPSGQRPEASKKFARISRGNIPTNEEGRANVEQFKKQIMQRPKTIFDMGEKSLHSTDEGQLTINTGIPALKAVLYDEGDGKFYVINTCPGAKDCIPNCYAMKAFYIMNDGKNLKLINRLQMMMNHPDDYERQAFMEAERYAFQAKQEGKKLKIRWNDAGDLFTDAYFEIVKNVDKALRDKGYDSSSYIYTKMGKYIELSKEAGIKPVFSSGATEAQRKIVGDLSKTSTQITVPTDVTKPFFIVKSGGRFEKDETGKTKFRDDTSREKVRKAVFDFYNTHPNPSYAFLRGKLDINRLKFTDELPKQIGNDLEFDTITLPGGDSDVPAQRKDVRFNFLTEH